MGTHTHERVGDPTHVRGSGTGRENEVYTWHSELRTGKVPWGFREKEGLAGQ